MSLGCEVCATFITGILRPWMVLTASSTLSNTCLEKPKYLFLTPIILGQWEKKTGCSLAKLMRHFKNSMGRSETAPFRSPLGIKSGRLTSKSSTSLHID